MNLRTFLILIVGLSVMGIAYAATAAPTNHDADFINRIFDDGDLIFKRLAGWFSAMTALASTAAFIYLRLVAKHSKETAQKVEDVKTGQAVATVERQTQASKLEDVKQAVQTVQAAVAPPSEEPKP
jgi:hypothetical protein